jgi:hypothetical protein
MCPQTGRPRFERLGDDGVAAGVAHGHGNIIHFFPERPRLRPPIENAADFRRGQIAARGLQAVVRRRHGARHGEEDRQRRATGVLEHPFDARHIGDVADFVAVAEHRRGAIQQGRLGKGAGGHHAALDVHVGIDQAGRNNPTTGVIDPGSAQIRFAIGARRLHRGDAPAHNPQLPLGVDPLGVRRKDAGAGDDKLGDVRPIATAASRRVIECRGDG